MFKWKEIGRWSVIITSLFLISEVFLPMVNVADSFINILGLILIIGNVLVILNTITYKFKNNDDKRMEGETDSRK